MPTSVLGRNKGLLLFRLFSWKVAVAIAVFTSNPGFFVFWFNFFPPLFIIRIYNTSATERDRDC